MDEDQERYRSHLFTVRLWLEDLGDGQTEWRGKVQYIQSGEVRYFRDWTRLCEFMLELMPRDEDKGLILKREVTMSDDHAELRKLNQDTFKAEEGGGTKVGNDGWEDFLRNVLAEDFIIRRAKPDLPNQNREGMIAHITKSGQTDPRTILPEEILWSRDETLGVVVCPVMYKGKRYQNIKVFNKQPQGDWQCVYWQVTEAPTL